MFIIQYLCCVNHLTHCEECELHISSCAFVEIIHPLSQHVQVCWLRLPESWEDSSYCHWWRVPSLTGRNTKTLRTLYVALIKHYITTSFCKTRLFVNFIDKWRCQLLSRLHSRLLSWSPLHSRKTSIVCELALDAHEPSGHLWANAVVTAYYLASFKAFLILFYQYIRTNTDDFIYRLQHTCNTMATVCKVEFMTCNPS